MAPSIIKSIETFNLLPRWIFVRVETEDGIVGWGEATLEGHQEAVQGAYQDLRARFIGVDADAIQDIWQTCYMMRFYRGGPVLMSALAGLDIALWDIKGKKLGVPVWQLLGGKIRDRIKVYGWIGGDNPSKASIAEQALNRKKQGFAAVKMNGTEMIDFLDSPKALEGTVERLKHIKEYADIDVGIDFHGRLHKGMAKQLAKMLEPHRPLFIEEPLLPTQPEEIADLSRQVSIPIALGERLYSRYDFRPYFEKRAIDIAQPDIAHVGGITELNRIASLAETYDVGLAPHCPLGPLALAASMSVDTVAPNFVIQEMSWQMHYNLDSHQVDANLKADLYTYITNPEVLEVKNGHIEILQGPGLGVNVNEELVRSRAKDYAENGYPSWKNPVWRGADGGLREW